MRNFLAEILLFVTLLTPLAGHADPLYAVHFLPDVDFSPTGMNNAGQIVGFAGAGDGTVHAVLYGGGVLTDLGNLGGKDSYATAINDAGAITGSIVSAAGEHHAFLYSGGTVRDLGAGTMGYGINAGGDVVGSKATTSGLAGFVYRAGQLLELGHPGVGTEGIAVSINDHGVVAGDLTNTASRHPFLYQDGALHDLGALDGHAVNGVVAINNAGQIAGYSGDNMESLTHAFLYDRGVLKNLGGLGDSTLEIHDLNEHGMLVGNAFNEDEGLVPFISLGDALVDLNTLIDPTLGWRIFNARATNDLGQIVGYGCRDTTCGLVRLDLTSAVPEPDTVFLLMPGLLALAATRRRRSPDTVVSPSW